MTGRAAGYCAGYGAPGSANPIPGRGFGMGWGRGRGGGWGWRNQYYATGLPGWARFGYAPAWAAPPTGAYGPYTAPPAGTYGPYAAPPTPEQETEFLRTQAEWLKEQLDAIIKRIEEIEGEK